MQLGLPWTCQALNFRGQGILVSTKCYRRQNVMQVICVTDIVRPQMELVNQPKKDRWIWSRAEKSTRKDV